MRSKRDKCDFHTRILENVFGGPPMYTPKNGGTLQAAVETLLGKKIIPILVKYIRSVPRERLGGSKTELLKHIRSQTFVLDESSLEYLERALSMGIVVLKSNSYEVPELKYSQFIIVYNREPGEWFPVAVGQSRDFVQPAELYTIFDKSDMFTRHIGKVCSNGMCVRLTLNNTIESVERSLGMKVSEDDKPLLIRLITVYVQSTIFQRKLNY